MTTIIQVMGDVAGPPLDDPVPVNVYAEAAIWAGVVVANEGTVSEDRMAIIRRLFFRWKDAGVYNLIDHANGWWAENEVQARVGLRSLAIATAVNSPTFETTGVTGNGATAYYNTGYASNASARAAKGGRLHYGAQILTNVAGTMSVMGASSGAVARLRPRTGSDTVGAQLASALGAFADAMTTSVGYVSVQRAGTAIIQGRKDDAALTDLTVGSLTTALPSTTTFVLARNNEGVAAEFYTGKVGFTYEAAPFTSVQWSAVRASILEFGQSAGAL